MIFVRDKGQMCNNILQFAHVYAWAKENGCQCISMRFAYKYQYFNICTEFKHNFFSYLLGKFMAFTGIIPVVAYNDINEDKSEKERFILSHRSVMVEGWCVRYFDLFHKYKEDIKTLFRFKPSIQGKIDAYIHNTSSQDEVKIGIHIRRGDYKTWLNGVFYFSDEEFITYVNRFIQSLANKPCVVYICGNASALDHDKFKSSIKSSKVYFPNGNPGEDLCLLSQCDYVIGPPSSFSLVASMYGKARLFWITSHEAEAAKIDFKDFDEQLPRLDSIWNDTYERCHQK